MSTVHSNSSTMTVNGSVVDFTSSYSCSAKSTSLLSLANANIDKAEADQKCLATRRLQSFLQDTGDRRGAERSVPRKNGTGRETLEGSMDADETKRVMSEALRGWETWFEDAGRREGRKW
ncbi:hypothetical protein ACMFMF_000319 [Clarireedia jacksonii]